MIGLIVAITGDETFRSGTSAQIFLARFFQGFGFNGSLDVGGSPEFRVLKSSEDGDGMSFADYVGKPVVQTTNDTFCTGLPKIIVV